MGCGIYVASGFSPTSRTRGAIHPANGGISWHKGQRYREEAYLHLHGDVTATTTGLTPCSVLDFVLRTSLEHYSSSEVALEA